MPHPPPPNFADEQAATDAAALQHPLLQLSGVTKRFGSLAALNDLSFDVRPGEIFGVAGPNGAGKSTLLNVCTGLLRPDRGELAFDGQRLNGLRPHRFCHAGIARTFQIPHILSSLTIGENISTGAMFGGADVSGSDQTERTESALTLTGLADRRDASSSAVDLLTRKMIMLAAALATGPRLIFMDEPFAGLNAAEIDAFMALINGVHQDEGISFVIVEHKVRALSELSDRIVILNFGRLVRVDSPDTIMNDPEVIDLYLGAGRRAHG